MDPNNSVVFFEENDAKQLFEPRQVKADIDTLISKMKEIQELEFKALDPEFIELKKNAGRNYFDG